MAHTPEWRPDAVECMARGYLALAEGNPSLALRMLAEDRIAERPIPRQVRRVMPREQARRAVARNLAAAAVER